MHEQLLDDRFALFPSTLATWGKVSEALDESMLRFSSVCQTEIGALSDCVGCNTRPSLRGVLAEGYRGGFVLIAMIDCFPLKQSASKPCLVLSLR